jgi:hypothetical protein
MDKEQKLSALRILPQVSTPSFITWNLPWTIQASPRWFLTSLVEAALLSFYRQMLDRLRMSVLPQQHRTKCVPSRGIIFGHSKAKPLGHQVGEIRTVVLPFAQIHFAGSNPDNLVEAQPQMRNLQSGQSASAIFESCSHRGSSPPAPPKAHALRLMRRSWTLKLGTSCAPLRSESHGVPSSPRRAALATRQTRSRSPS